MYPTVSSPSTDISSPNIAARRSGLRAKPSLEIIEDAMSSASSICKEIASKSSLVDSTTDSGFFDDNDLPAPQRRPARLISENLCHLSGVDNPHLCSILNASISTPSLSSLKPEDSIFERRARHP
jgi:hypothetical protein